MSWLLISDLDASRFGTTTEPSDAFALAKSVLVLVSGVFALIFADAAVLFIKVELKNYKKRLAEACMLAGLTATTTVFFPSDFENINVREPRVYNIPLLFQHVIPVMFDIALVLPRILLIPESP